MQSGKKMVNLPETHPIFSVTTISISNLISLFGKMFCGYTYDQENLAGKKYG